MDDVAVFKCARFGFIAVADEVNWLCVVRRNEPPLHTRWETSTTTTSETRCFHLIGDRLRLHRECFFELLVAAIVDVTVDRCVPAFAVNIFKDEAVLTWVRFFAWDVGDFAHG